MREYHKIVTVYERDPETKFKTLLEGKWATPELAYLQDNDWLWSEKIDGTNIRVKWDGEKVEFGGKTDAAQLYTPLLSWMQTKFYAGALARWFDGPACLYGEGFGAGIQSGGKYRADTVMILFDVWVGGLWLTRESVQDIANKLEIDCVATVGRGPLSGAIAVARTGFSSAFGSCTAEGLVMRPTCELLDRRGNRIITKIKTKDF
jgi:hypothetical protein